MKRKKILIVDDDIDLVKALSKRLRSHSYSTVHAEDAVSAIRVAKKEQPDLIILDVGLPAGDGFVVMDRLNTSIDISSIPVIMITGRDPSTTFEQSLQIGAAAYFQKPLDDEQLLSVIRTLLEDGSAESTGEKERG